MRASDLDQRTLQRLVDRRHLLGDEARLQHAPQPQRRRRRPRRRIRVALSIGTRAKPMKVAARARDFAEADRLVAEQALGERIHAVVVAGRARVERVGDQHRVVDRRDVDAALGEHVHVELDVLADLEDARRLEQRLQQRDRFRLRDLAGRKAAAVEEIVRAVAMADRNVAGLARLDRQRDADEIGLQRVGRGRLGVEGDDARRRSARAIQRLKLGRGPHGLVGRRGRSAPRASLARAAARSAGVARLRRGLRRAWRGEWPRGEAARLRGASLSAPAAPRPGRPASRRGRRSAGRARSSRASTPQISATRRVIVVSSIALKKAMSRLPSSFGRRKRLERRLDRHVANQCDELLRDPDPLRRFRDWSALRGASAA